MDHWHAESLLIRIISIFQQGLCFFFRSYVERRRLSGPASCQSSRRLRPPCSLLLTSSPPFAFTSVRGPASTPPPSPPPLLYNRKLKRGGRGTSQHALHPHLVTSRSVMYACFHLRGVFSTSVLRASFLPSFLPTMCSEGIFIQPAVRRGRVEADPLPSRSAIFNRPPPSSVGPQRRAAALRGGRG